MEVIPEMEKLDMSFGSSDAAWRDEDLDEILALLGEAPPAPKLPPEPEEADEIPEDFPVIPRQASMSEAPVFDEKPEKPRKPWVLVVLALTAVAEIGALVGILIWWQQWIA